MATRQKDLYAEDYYAWTQDQAAALRRLAREHWNGPLDLNHLAEEVEDSGNEVRSAVRSQLRRLMEHILKLEHARATEPCLGWMRTVANARAEIATVMTPPPDVGADLQLLYTRARRERAGAAAREGRARGAPRILASLGPAPGRRLAAGKPVVVWSGKGGGRDKLGAGGGGPGGLVHAN